MSWPQLALGIGSILIGLLFLEHIRRAAPSRSMSPAARPVFVAAGVMLVLNGILQTSLAFGE